jgi:hypothetical protein
MTDRMGFVRKFPDKCCAEVTRNREFQPCDKTAIGVTSDPDGGDWFPVCAYHAYRQFGRRMVPLAKLVKGIIA